MRSKTILAAALALAALIPTGAHADPPETAVLRPYTTGYAPSTLCRTDSTIGGACFDIPADKRNFYVITQDDREHWTHFRVVLLDRDLLPIVDTTHYGEHCGWTPFWLRAPAHATKLVVEIAEDPSFMASWCPHVSDDGLIEVTFARSTSSAT